MAKHQLCRNCGSEVTGNYCSSCGQRTTTHRLNWGAFVESVTSTFIGDEAYGLRGINMRKGAVMTWLSILYRPHETIGEYIEGHRRKYFNPVAILLMLSTVYAVIFTLVGKEYTPKAAEGQIFLKWIFYTYLDYSQLHPATDILLTLPFFALAMKTIFRRRGDFKYVEYLYVGIFLSIFEVTLMIAALPAELLLKWYSSIYMNTLPVFVYTAFVFWKLFDLTKWGAVLRTLLVLLLHYVYIILTVCVLSVCMIVGYDQIAPEKFTGAVGNKPATEQEGTFLEELFEGLSDPSEEEQQPDAATRGEAPQQADSCAVSQEASRDNNRPKK